MAPHTTPAARHYGCTQCPCRLPPLAALRCLLSLARFRCGRLLSIHSHITQADSHKNPSKTTLQEECAWHAMHPAPTCPSSPFSPASGPPLASALSATCNSSSLPAHRLLASRSHPAAVAASPCLLLIVFFHILLLFFRGQQRPRLLVGFFTCEPKSVQTAECMQGSEQLPAAVPSGSSPPRSCQLRSWRHTVQSQECGR